jgi:hypothetical protein
VLLTLTYVDISRQVKNKVEGRDGVHDKRKLSVIICDIYTSLYLILHLSTNINVC